MQAMVAAGIKTVPYLVIDISAMCC